jgi:hypothetical protein
MGQGHNLSPQFGPDDVWYKSSASGHDTYAYERGSRKRVGVLQTVPKDWRPGNTGVHFIEVDESRRGQGIGTGMYAKFHERNPEAVVSHSEFSMSSSAKHMLPKLEQAFPEKHIYTPNEQHPQLFSTDRYQGPRKSAAGTPII